MWLALAFVVLMAGPASAEVTAAAYGAPTTRYDHGALGDRIEWGSLELTLSGCGGCGRRFVLPQSMVFEDTAPRLADLDGDGAPEVIVVETDLKRGARLAVWDETGRIAATPYIGQTHRWLAPLGAGDLDGDGIPEIAYVDRPHLARVLRLWHLRGGRLIEVAAQPGVTNHRLGDRTIRGGFRNCGRPELVVARADWGALLAARWDGRRISLKEIGADTSPAGFAAALACR